jgi:hypothetical protein
LLLVAKSPTWCYKRKEIASIPVGLVVEKSKRPICGDIIRKSFSQVKREKMRLFYFLCGFIENYSFKTIGSIKW